MIILSIYTGHNSSVAIIKDGEVLINIELERFTRIKHDYGYNEEFVLKCLDNCGLTINDITHLVFKPWECTLKELMRGGTILNPVGMPLTETMDMKQTEVEYLGKKFLAYNFDHHLCHAASAFYTSPFETSTIFTYDGGGDDKNASVSYGFHNRIESYQKMNVKNMGSWWSGVTFNNYRMKRIHDLDPGSGAGKIMALAAYGKHDPQINENLKRDIKLEIIKKEYIDKYSMAYNDCEDMSDTTEKKSKDLAWQLQNQTELYLLQYMNQAYDKIKDKNICYSGGLALNCVANSTAFHLSKFNRMHVPPFPNDTGIALGGALYLYHHILDNPREIKYFSPYTGLSYNGDEINIFNLKDKYPEYEILYCNESMVAKVLSKKVPVVLFRGKSECGPRALGHRSILCHPGIKNIRKYLNEEVKLREWYRPYAPVILDIYVKDIFENIVDSPYMTTNVKVKQKYRKQLEGICHIDGSTRPQILSINHEPYLYELLMRFNKLTGIPLLLNTSFNLQEPIVETIDDAMKTFSKIPLRYMVVNDIIIKKK